MPKKYKFFKPREGKKSFFSSNFLFVRVEEGNIEAVCFYSGGEKASAYSNWALEDKNLEEIPECEAALL
jgi:hypothetical protein